MRWVVSLLALPVLLAAGEVRIGVDPRVELFGILFRLAGAKEYTQGMLPAYNAAIDRHFAAFKDHDAVTLAKQLRKSDGVSYDAVMSMAVHVSDASEFRERVPFDAPQIELDKRWHGAKARKFVAAVRRFAKDSNFAAFLREHEALYRETDARLRAMVEEKGDIGWFAKFFGVQADATFVVVPGMVNGPGSYGPAFQPTEGTREVYAIIGAMRPDVTGVPQFEGEIGTLVHEFIHSYANPLINSRMKELARFGETLFQHTMADMLPQAYGNGATVLYESLVRAATVRYVFEHSGPEAARQAIQRERHRGFVWTPQVVEALGVYASSRDKYPSMQEYMPELIRVFGAAAADIGPMLKGFEAERPKVARISIANGAKDVDPATTELVIEFDRPMRKGNYSLARTGETPTPAFGRPVYNEEGTVLTVPITLEPGKDYAFSLNWPMGGSFASEAGVPLRQVEVKFRTKN